MNPQRLSNRSFTALALCLLIIALPATYAGVSRMFNEWTWLNDTHYFYNGARVVLDGRSEILYDYQARAEAGYGDDPHGQVFPYPATFAYVMAPLTLFDIVAARYVLTGFLGLCLAAVAVLGWRWSRDWRFGVLILLAAASSFAVIEGLRFQQLTGLLTLMLCAALLTSTSPRSLVGGFFCGLLALKPTIALAPLALITLRRGYLQIAVAAVTAALVTIVIPLLMVGLDGFQQFLDMLGRYRDESFTLQGDLTAGAGWMLGWQAIVARLSEGDPDVLTVVALDVLTVLVMLRVWLRGRYYDSWLAGTLTALLVVPHVLWYDWAVLLAVAPFAAYQRRSLPLVALLLALHAAISFDSFMIVSRPIYDAYPVPTTLLASVTLLYLAFVPVREQAAGEADLTELATAGAA